MYRILLVDDEWEILEYFERMLREGLGGRQDLDIYTMDSAEKVLEYFTECKVDVVIADIQMPGMNGLEMYAEVRKIWPKVKFIFLSGYLNFDYVYASAQDANTRFLTKLEPVEKIVGTVSDCLTELEQSYREREILKKAQEESRQAWPLLRNKVIGQFLYGNESRENILNNFRKFGVELDFDKEILLLGASLDGLGETVPPDVGERMGFVLKTLLGTYFKKNYVIYNHLSENPDVPYIWILQKANDGAARPEEILECVQHAFFNSVEDTVSFAYGSVAPDFLEITRMYRRIRNILGYRDRELTESIIPCGPAGGTEGALDLPQAAHIRVNWEELQHIGEMDGYMELGMEEKFFSLFDRMVEGFSSVSSRNHPLAQEIYSRIAVLLLGYINRWQLVEKIAFHVEMYRLMRVEFHENWEQAADFLRQCAQVVFRLHFKEEREGITNYIALVKNYIKEHLSEELNLVVLAEEVHLNTSYLSRLFHKETGERLYDYILRVRMGKATEYVVKDARRIQDIARSVGYESIQSFNRAFKKYTGMSPLDYRNGGRDGEKAERKG